MTTVLLQVMRSALPVAWRSVLTKSTPSCVRQDESTPLSSDLLLAINRPMKSPSSFLRRQLRPCPLFGVRAWGQGSCISGPGAHCCSIFVGNLPAIIPSIQVLEPTVAQNMKMDGAPVYSTPQRAQLLDQRPQVSEEAAAAIFLVNPNTRSPVTSVVHSVFRNLGAPISKPIEADFVFLLRRKYNPTLTKSYEDTRSGAFSKNK